MKATAKCIVSEKRRKADGTINVKLLVTHNRQSKQFSTDIFVTNKDITSDYKIKNTRLQSYANQIEIDARTIIAGIKHNISFDELAQIIKQELFGVKPAPKEEPKGFSLNIYPYIEKYIENRPQGTQQSYISTISAIKRYTGEEDYFDINRINYKWLMGFANFVNGSTMINDYVKVNRATHLYTTCLKAIHNRAKLEFNDEDEGILNIPLSPFAKFKLPKQIIPEKRSISIEVLQKLIALDLKGRACLSRDVFVLSFLLGGMNPIDIYHCDTIIDNRIAYKRIKTAMRRSDDAIVHILICNKAKELLEKYADPTGKRIFDFYTRYRTPILFCQTVSRTLRKIGDDEKAEINIPHFTVYSARHTWASIAANDCGIPTDIVHKTLNHSDPAMRITEVYIRKDWRRIDEAILKVEEFVYSQHHRIQE